jgi:hypothetical protein
VWGPGFEGHKGAWACTGVGVVGVMCDPCVSGHMGNCLSLSHRGYRASPLLRIRWFETIVMYFQSH